MHALSQLQLAAVSHFAPHPKDQHPKAPVRLVCSVLVVTVDEYDDVTVVFAAADVVLMGTADGIGSLMAGTVGAAATVEVDTLVLGTADGEVEGDDADAVGVVAVGAAALVVAILVVVAALVVSIGTFNDSVSSMGGRSTITPPPQAQHAAVAS